MILMSFIAQPYPVGLTKMTSNMQRRISQLWLHSGKAENFENFRPITSQQRKAKIVITLQVILATCTL